MANTLITPSLVAREALMILHEARSVSRLVHTDYAGDFTGSSGDTVTIRKPATFTAVDFAAASDGEIDIQDATEGSTSVTLDEIPDVSFAVTTKDLSLEIADFSAQFVEPAAIALVEYIDALACGALEDAAADSTAPDPVAEATAGDPKVLIQARKALNENNVPQGMRRTVASHEMAAGWLGSSLFHEADKRGDTRGLVEAEIGRKFGFDNFETGHLAGDDSVAFHRNAVALVLRTPSAPNGASNSATLSYEGLGIRVTQDYDIRTKTDIISMDLLAGATVLDPRLAVSMTPPADSSSA